MPNVKITEQLFRAVIINGTKKYVEEYEVNLSEAFKDVVSQYYYYSIGQLEQAETNEGRAAYIAMIYDFVISESVLPYEWFNLICRYYRYGCEFCELDKEYLKFIRSAFDEEQEQFYKLKSETERIRHILECQKFIPILNLIKPLVEFYDKTNVSGLTMFINLFNYGYIMGIRAERAKRQGKSIK